MYSLHKNEINNALNENKGNKGSYHVNQWLWSILQKFRGFKLICKHYFMHKVKKASIIIKNEINH